jgi:catechol 2,3-dioxygenase-like lactoylglutathione lyase family enzyme
MFSARAAFSSFSVKDLAKAQEFYGKTLGLKVEKNEMGLRVHLPGGGVVFVYGKGDHQPASFTILNLQVDDIDAAVDELGKKGVRFEHYDNGIKTDAKGIARGLEQKQGPDIAWFKDPSDNFVAVLQDSR